LLSLFIDFFSPRVYDKDKFYTKRDDFLKRLAWILDYALMAAIAALIIVFAVLREQSFLKTLPTLITLVVLVLLANANRFAFLLGGTNALLYGI